MVTTIIYNSKTKKTRYQDRELGSDKILERDASGNINYSGSSDAETMAINAGATERDNAPTREQQVQEKEKQRLADAETIAKMTPPNLSPEQAANIGQLNPDIINDFSDPTSVDIATNINARNNGLNYITGTSVDKFIPQNTAINLLPKLTAFASKLPGGTSTINALAQDRKLREYLKDYSNEESLKSVKGNIATADTQINDMITNAKLTANTPENVKVTQTIYNDAQSRKFKTMSQLRAIAAGDQRAYTDNIKDDLVELELYFYGDKLRGTPPGKIADDDALFAALNKPTPKYINAGGINND
jgi:hypothetical protein